MIQIAPLRGIGEVAPGADLAAVLGEALDRERLALRPADMLVITQKIVAKAEGRFVRLCEVEPSAEARRLAELTRKDARLVELVLRESSEVVRAVPHVLARPLEEDLFR